MSLKQLNDLERILFLKEFTIELMITSVIDERLKKLIKVEKIKKKFLEPFPTPEITQIGESSIFPPVNGTSHPIKPKTPATEPDFQKSVTIQPSKTIAPTKPISPSRALAVHPAPIITPTGNAIVPSPGVPKALQTTQPESSEQKIDLLIKDPSVQMIECPGPGKNILVKVRNKINTTRITLGEAEIKNIINHFSKTAKIPVSGGILKAAIEDLIISAIISEHVGSRFIINKQSPYELIEGVSPGTQR